MSHSLCAPFPRNICFQLLADSFYICLQTCNKLKLVLYFWVSDLIYWPLITRMRFSFLSLSPPTHVYHDSILALSPSLHFPCVFMSWFYPFFTCSTVDVWFLWSWDRPFTSLLDVLFLGLQVFVFDYSLILISKSFFMRKVLSKVNFRLINQFSIFVFIDSLAGYRILDWKSFGSLKALLLLILISIVAIEKCTVFEIWLFFLESTRIFSLTLKIWNCTMTCHLEKNL